MVYLLTGLAFGFGFLVIFAVNWLLADIFEAKRKETRQRLDEEFRLRQRERARGTMQQHRDLYELAAEGYADLAAHRTGRERFHDFLMQSGLRMRTGQIVVYSILMGVFPAVLVAVLTGRWVFALPTAVVGAVVPFWYVYAARRRRLEKLLSQLPDAFDLMGRVLRAGQTMSQALQSVGDEFSRPISEEFAYCYEQQNLGLSPEAALRDLSARTGLLEMKIFVLAVTVHRQTGGNLSELLDKLSHVIRDRYRIRGLIKSLTAEGRFQGIILLALPIFLLIFLTIVNPGYMATLFEYPLLLVAMFVAEGLGALWIRNIVNFDF